MISMKRADGSASRTMLVNVGTIIVAGLTAWLAASDGTVPTWAAAIGVGVVASLNAWLRQLTSQAVRKAPPKDGQAQRVADVVAASLVFIVLMGATGTGCARPARTYAYGHSYTYKHGADGMRTDRVAIERDDRGRWREVLIDTVTYEQCAIVHRKTGKVTPSPCVIVQP